MSQEELLSVFQSLFTTLNGRDSTSLQKHELLLFSGAESFDQFATEIFYEIYGLENGDFYDSKIQFTDIALKMAHGLLNTTIARYGRKWSLTMLEKCGE